MEASVCYFESLPDEVAVKIIALAAKRNCGDLCRVGAVCKRFQSLLKQIDAFSWYFPGSGLLEGQLVSFLSAAKNVTNLSLLWDVHTQHPPSVGFIAGILASTPKLQKLRLSDVPLGQDSTFTANLGEQLFRCISKICPSLHSLCLSFRSCGNLEQSLPDRTSFHNLRELSLSLQYCIVSAPFLENLINPLPALESVCFSGGSDLHARAHLRSTSLRYFRCEGEGIWFEELDVLNLVCLDLAVVSDLYLIKAPTLSILHLGDPDNKSLGRLRSTSKWTLKFLNLMGDWEIDHFTSVLLCCQEVLALDLPCFKFVQGTGTTCGDSDAAAHSVIDSLGCVHEFAVDIIDTFSYFDRRLVPSAAQIQTLRSLKCLTLVFDYEGYDLDLKDLEIAEDLLALSPSVERVDILIQSEGDAEEELTRFTKVVAERWPNVRLLVETFCNICKAKNRWHVEKTGRCRYFQWFEDW